MVKSYINFRNCLCISERSLFLRGCFYFVFILQNFGSLAPLIFFKQLFFIKINFSHMKHCVSFVFTNSIFFQNIKLSFIETIIFSNKQFIISMDYNLKFLSNVIELNFSTTTKKKKKKKELKRLNILGRKSQVIEYYSHRKLIPLMKRSLIGMAVLKVHCCFQTEPQIHVAS